MNIISNRISAGREFSQILKTRRENKGKAKKLPSMITGLCEGALDAFLAAFITEECMSEPSLIIVQDEKSARHIAAALGAYGIHTLVYPARDPVLYNMVASHEAEYDRVSALSEISEGNGVTVIATPDAAMQFTMPADKLREGAFTLAVGDTVDMAELSRRLVDFGYVPCELVDGKGRFAVRGGIADIFSPQSELPLRIELFGDEVDRIGYFDIITQRWAENLRSAKIVPAREIIPDAEARGRIKSAIQRLMKKAKSESVRSSLSGELTAVQSGAEILTAEKYLPLIYEKRECLLDYFGADSAVFIAESSGVSDRLRASLRHGEETAKQLLEEGVMPAGCGIFMKDEADLLTFAEKTGALIANAFLSQYAGRLWEIYSIHTRTTSFMTGNAEALCEDIESYTRAKYEIIIAAGSETEAANTRDILLDNGINCAFIPKIGDITELTRGVPVITAFSGAGFEIVNGKFMLLSLGEGRAEQTRTRSSRRSKVKKTAKEKILSYADLTVGDYVVHDTHGIGKYMGLETIRDYTGVCHDHIKIQYSGTDVLYVRCEQIETVSKYIGAGADEGTIKLSKLGGTEWGKTKARVKSEVRQMAKELIALYAERMRRPGFAFEPDDDMQREFESLFEYEETDGQLAAAEDIKRDMEKPVPMDRLLCGDVGFGKTEVALRAAFKAVDNGKQVAILVPTTILAMQHYQTIVSRMRGFPIKVSLLSRFKTHAEQEAAVRALRRGDTDIIVGTHRLLSADIQFHDLGLVIIDEEQRFGVAHKEKLKQIAKNVDVLTLTATPIPRTLNMAMNSIRDMSVLDEAPGDRMPVQTYVLEYDDLVINEAIRRELHRGGQVFYLHNRIENIAGTAARLKKEFPDANIDIAHGRMEKEELADIWQSLVEGDTDILVCTTIIETGVDVPNANTLIIENADTMGLSQLHQIRGRVGRSARRAYAYFTYRQGKALSDISTKRLSAIRDFTEFGSGFKIALRDLEIRGAGDILGTRQHGHMESVGYDMYLKILNEAVLEEQGTVIPKKTECTISVGRDAYIPESYISSVSQRIDMYKKIAAIENEADADDIADEMLDRYGDMPQSVETLLSASLVRAMGSACGITQIDKRDNAVAFYPEQPDFLVLSELSVAFPARITIVPSEKTYFSCRIKRGETVFEIISNLLKKYIQIKSKKE